MDIEITLKNYRCFEDQSPARFRLKKGFISFIGVNNAGKSSLLKFFHEFRQLFDGIGQQHLVIPSLYGNALIPGYGSSVKDRDEVFCNLNTRNLEIDLVFQHSQPDTEESPLPYPSRAAITISRTHICSLVLFDKENKLDIGSNIDLTGTSLRQGGKPFLELKPLLDACRMLTQTFYIGPFRNAINVGANNNYWDILVGQAFINHWHARKTGNRKKSNEALIRLTDDIKRIFDFKSLEINAADEESDLKVFIDGKSYNLSELGAGLAQFIVVFANVALLDVPPSYIMIDEPELNLHPALQLDFLTSLASYASEGILFATHNVGLARAASEQIYSLRRNVNGVREVVPLEAMTNGSLSEFLGELSFSGYREIGYDKLLLVEGSTDVPTIQQFLRLYGKDHKVVLMPIGGASAIKASSDVQLQELKRITDNIVVLIDSERSFENAPLSDDRQGFVEICKRIGIPCHVLNYRAIENYLTDRAIKAVKGDKYSALKHFDLLNAIEPKWAKSENWKIARGMTKQELENTDLGQILGGL